MERDQAKWYCPCGQINAGHMQECVNCGGASTEGSPSPPSLEEALASGRPLPPPGVRIDITNRVAKRVRLYEDEQELLVTERRLGRWVGFLLFSAAAGLFALFLKEFMPAWALEEYSLWVYFAPVSVPALLFGVFGTFPHTRLMVTRYDRSCIVQRRWLVFTYSAQSFSLEKYFLISGERRHQEVVERTSGWTLLLGLFIGVFSILLPKGNGERRETLFPAVAATMGIGCDHYNLLSFCDVRDVDRVLAAASRLVPDRVLVAAC